MPRKKVSFSRTDVRAAWSLLEKMGQKPVFLQINPDGSFCISTAEHAGIEAGSESFSPEGSPVISAADLRNVFTDVIRKDIGITPSIIKGWLAEYNAAGVNDLYEEEREAVHKKLLTSLAARRF